jgi:SHS2 domain-containing protein
MEMPVSGYREHEHTADWELEVWAPDLSSLLEQAARGMFSLAGARHDDGSRLVRHLEVRAHDAESLLVGFLSELLYLADGGLYPAQFQLELDEYNLKADVSGPPLTSLSKEIKAVTYHNLKVVRGKRGLQTRIVFDV